MDFLDAGPARRNRQFDLASGSPLRNSFEPETQYAFFQALRAQARSASTVLRTLRTTRLASLFQQLFFLLDRLWTPTVRTNSVFPSLALRSQRNCRYLRCRLGHSKEPASATDC